MPYPHKYITLTPDEHNNSAGSTIINIPFPDLQITQIIPLSTVIAAGTTLPVSNTVFNSGPGNVARAFYIGFRLSQNQVWGDADDIILTTTRYVGSLLSGAGKTAVTNIGIPHNTPEGSYYILAYADSTNRLIEANEDNNSAGSREVVKIDRTPPEITINSPLTDYYYTVSDIIPVSYIVSDNLSGIDFEIATLNNEEMANNTQISADHLKLGENIFTVIAYNGVGLMAEKTIRFNLGVTISSLISLVDRYYTEGAIYN